MALIFFEFVKPFGILGCNTLQRTATLWNTLEMPCCNALTHTATHSNTMQHTAIHCNTLQHTQNAAIRSATRCNKLQHSETHSKCCAATHCHTLQRTLTQCNTMQHTATHSKCYAATHYRTLQHIVKFSKYCTGTRCIRWSHMWSSNNAQLDVFCLASFLRKIQTHFKTHHGLEAHHIWF